MMPLIYLQLTLLTLFIKNCESVFNPFTPTDLFSSIQNNEWKNPLMLLSGESAFYCAIPREININITLVLKPVLCHLIDLKENYKQNNQGTSLKWVTWWPSWFLGKRNKSLACIFGLLLIKFDDVAIVGFTKCDRWTCTEDLE